MAELRLRFADDCWTANLNGDELFMMSSAILLGKEPRNAAIVVRGQAAIPEVSEFKDELECVTFPEVCDSAPSDNVPRLADYLAIVVTAAIREAGVESNTPLCVQLPASTNAALLQSAVEHVKRALCITSMKVSVGEKLLDEPGQHLLASYTIDKVTSDGCTKIWGEHDSGLALAVRSPLKDKVADKVAEFTLEYMKTLDDMKTKAEVVLELPGDPWDLEGEYLVEVYRDEDGSFQIKALVGDRSVPVAVRGSGQESWLELMDGRAYRLTFGEKHMAECDWRRKIQTLVRHGLYCVDPTADGDQVLKKL